MFFSSLKLQYCRTVVLLNFSKKPLFQKRRWSRDFPPRKTPVAQKHRAVSRQEKNSILHPPVGLSCDSSPPPPESVRAYADSQPKFLGWIQSGDKYLFWSVFVSMPEEARRGPKKLRFILSNQRELRTRAEK